VNERDDTSRPGDFALDEPLPLGAREPVDVVQVRADEALIAALSRADHVYMDDPIDERLAGLLRSWRDDVHAEPERPLVDVGSAMATVAAARTPAEPVRRPNRPSYPFGPLATAAAVLVIAFIGLGLAAKDAEPGQPLWNVTKVIYSDKARSVEAAITVQAKLNKAHNAYQDRNIVAAMLALEEAKQQLHVVAPEDGKNKLETQAQQIVAEMTGTPGAEVPIPTSTSDVVSDPTTTEPTESELPESILTQAPDPTTSPAEAPSPTTTQPPAPVTTPSTGPGETTPEGSPQEGAQRGSSGDRPPANGGGRGVGRRP